MCVDFTDLNSMPEGLLSSSEDKETRGQRLSTRVDELHGRLFGYDQIRMVKKDEDKTSFITHQGTYCQKVMPFGAGARYQRQVNQMFANQLEKASNPVLL